MDWEDIRNVFRPVGDGKSQESAAEANAAVTERSAFRTVACPKCGAEGCMAEIDVVPGLAKIQGVYGDGTIEWQGETKVDWDNQRPASDPPRFVCLACGEESTREGLGIR
jgi:hypothetical protein